MERLESRRAEPPTLEPSRARSAPCTEVDAATARRDAALGELDAEAGTAPGTARRPGRLPADLLEALRQAARQHGRRRRRPAATSAAARAAAWSSTPPSRQVRPRPPERCCAARSAAASWSAPGVRPVTEPDRRGGRRPTRPPRQPRVPGRPTTRRTGPARPDRAHRGPGRTPAAAATPGRLADNVAEYPGPVAGGDRRLGRPGSPGPGSARVTRIQDSPSCSPGRPWSRCSSCCRSRASRRCDRAGRRSRSASGRGWRSPTSTPVHPGPGGSRGFEASDVAPPGGESVQDLLARITGQVRDRSTRTRARWSWWSPMGSGRQRGQPRAGGRHPGALAGDGGAVLDHRGPVRPDGGVQVVTVNAAAHLVDGRTVPNRSGEQSAGDHGQEGQR